MNKEAAIIEAVLFLENEPIEMKKLSKITQLSREVLDSALRVLQEKYMSEQSGLELSSIGGGWSLVPKKELWVILKETYGKKTDDKLSKAALETLSIIAYSQPLTRPEMESIRGVNVSTVLKMLEERDLIKEVGRKDAPGRPVQYGTTKEFLKVFHLNSLAELPRLNEIDEGKFELEGRQS